MKTTLTLTAAALMFASTGSTAQAGSPRAVDDVADALARETALLARIVEHDFRHVAHYRHLAEDMHEMAAHADHVHDIAHHHPGRVRHLLKDVEELHDLVDHVEGLIDDIKDDLRHGHRGRARAIRHRSIALHFRRGVTRKQVRRLERALDDVHDTVDDLEDCLRHRHRHTRHHGHHGRRRPRSTRSSATIGLPIGRYGYIHFRIR